MSPDSIPADGAFPIASPVILYWRGLAHLAREWERTKQLANNGEDIDALHEYLFWRMNLVIWSCSAIEGFVNEEGVAWLGEGFFKSNLERLGICQKIAVVYALKYTKRLSESDALLREVDRLFAFRNRLVHPKAKTVKQDRGRSDTMRGELDRVSPDELRETFRRVARLFEPSGVGEE